MGRQVCLTMPNARLYLTETTRLFTQLWASLQSGEADGGDEGIRTLERVTPLLP